MIQPVRVKLTRRANRQADCVAVTIESKAREADVIKEASKVLKVWTKLMLATEVETVDYEVLYQDGKVMRGRYELFYRNVDGDLLGNQIKRVLELQAGVRCPDHLSKEEATEVLAMNEEQAERASRWLQGYRIWQRQI